MSSFSAGSMNKIIQVAWREVRYTALTPAFLLGVVGVPVAMLGLLMLYPLLLSQESRPLEGALALIDPTGQVARQAETIIEEERLNSGMTEEIEKAMEKLPVSPRMGGGVDPLGLLNTAIDIEIESYADPTVLDDLKERLQAGELVGVAVIPEQLLEIPTDPDEPSAEPGESGDSENGATFDLFLPMDSAPNQTITLERLLKKAVVETRADRAGVDHDLMQRILEQPRIAAIRVSETGENPENVKIRMILPIMLMMLLWVSTFTSGNYILTSTIEEKSNRVMEVLLSAVSPMQLMTGKILGQSLVAAFMLVMYGGMAIIGLLVLAMADLISFGLISLSLCYFVIAYFTVAAMMAAIGSAVSDLRDAQSLMGPAVLVLILPLILWMPISNHPDSMLAIVSGFIPPLIPFVMILRVAGSPEALPAWQIIVSLVLGGGSVVVMLWICARIFRVGVLMQGKPPSPLELLRWLRYR